MSLAAPAISMNQYPLTESKAALVFWAIVLLFSLFSTGWLTYRYGHPIIQSVLLTTLACWMVTAHRQLYDRLRQWRLQWVPDTLRLLLFIILGYQLARWVL